MGLYGGSNVRRQVNAHKSIFSYESIQNANRNATTLKFCIRHTFTAIITNAKVSF